MNTTPRKFYAADIPASGQSDKKLTPMAAHIEWLKIRVQHLRSRGSTYLAHELQEAINHATSLLEAEREMVEKAYDAGVSPYGENNGSDYFTQNYRQQ